MGFVSRAAPPQAAQPHPGDQLAAVWGGQERAMMIWREKASRIAKPQKRHRANSMRVLTSLA
jgi:hypothetical protein